MIASLFISFISLFICGSALSSPDPGDLVSHGSEIYQVMVKVNVNGIYLVRNRAGEEAILKLYLNPIESESDDAEDEDIYATKYNSRSSEEVLKSFKLAEELNSEFFFPIYNSGMYKVEKNDIVYAGHLMPVDDYQTLDAFRDSFRLAANSEDYFSREEEWIVENARRLIALGVLMVKMAIEAHDLNIAVVDISLGNVTLPPEFGSDPSFANLRPRYRDYELLSDAGEANTAGTPATQDPLALDDRVGVGFETDLHSIGAVLLDLALGQHPFFKSQKLNKGWVSGDRTSIARIALGRERRILQKSGLWEPLQVLLGKILDADFTARIEALESAGIIRRKEDSGRYEVESCYDPFGA